MEILHKTTTFDFMRLRSVALLLSTVLIAGTVWLWIEKGDEKFGVDFRGGHEVVVKFKDAIEIGALRDALSKSDFKEATVQNFEGLNNEFSIRLRSASGESLAKGLESTFRSFEGNTYEILKQDFVGPVIGEKIRKDAVIAFIVGLVGILLYVTARFNVVFALSAIVALFHDGVVALGATMFMGIDIGAATLAAVLTIVGYSVNDTIIIFDRIRENLTLKAKSGTARKKGEAGAVSGLTMSQIINLSINETLSRTIITSLTVMLVCLTLYVFGGGAVSELAFTLLIGVIVGTYSTVFVAAPLVALLPERAPKNDPVLS